jgi:signal transduction histidine kinase
VSDGWGGHHEALLEVFGQVPRYGGRGRPPTKKHPQAHWLYLQLVKQRQHGRVVGTHQRFGSGDLTARVQEQRQDEVGQLAQQVNQMAEALQQNMQILCELAHSNTILAQQAERLRLSRDLHDAIAQRLFSLMVSTATMPDLIHQDQTKGVQQTKSITNLAEQTLLDLRTLLLELRPTAMLQQTLAEAIRHLCNDWQQSHQTLIDLSLLLTGRYLPVGVENTVYYILQESLNNISKHAQASLIAVSLLEKPQQLILSVTDNGRGFVDSQSRPGQFGLLSMRERANALGGQLHIESDTARGCTVRLLLPIPQP